MEPQSQCSHRVSHLGVSSRYMLRNKLDLEPRRRGASGGPMKWVEICEGWHTVWPEGILSEQFGGAYGGRRLILIVPRI